VRGYKGRDGPVLDGDGGDGGAGGRQRLRHHRHIPETPRKEQQRSVVSKYIIKTQTQTRVWIDAYPCMCWAAMAPARRFSDVAQPSLHTPRGRLRSRSMPSPMARAVAPPTATEATATEEDRDSACDGAWSTHQEGEWDTIVRGWWLGLCPVGV